MKTKENIVHNWLPRYTGTPIEGFGEYIILVNFYNYVEKFAEKFGVKICGLGYPMQTATAENITIINFGMGSAMAATIMDLLSAINPKALLFLGKCGGLKKITKVGDLILPIAAIRAEGASDEYMPREVPALPAFQLQLAVSRTIKEFDLYYWTGTVYTTNRRVWEHDEKLKKYLRDIRTMAIDMETASIFTIGFANGIPSGALLLVSDNPMIPEGVKTAESDSEITKKYVEMHLEIGIASMRELRDSGESVKHLHFE